MPEFDEKTADSLSSSLVLLLEVRKKDVKNSCILFKAICAKYWRKLRINIIEKCNQQGF